MTHSVVSRCQQISSKTIGCSKMLYPRLLLLTVMIFQCNVLPYRRSSNSYNGMCVAWIVPSSQYYQQTRSCITTRQLQNYGSTTSTRTAAKTTKIKIKSSQYRHRAATTTSSSLSSSSLLLRSSLSSNDENDDDDDYNVYVMVNGMPGPMATAAAEACLRKGLLLSPMAMTGPDVEASTITVTDSITKRSTDVRLLPSSNVEEIQSTLIGIRTAMENTNDVLLAIDYTHPSAVNQNGKFYVQHQIPFVMGTTGGDREQLLSDVTNKVMCVIAPNMGKQIVAMQLALSDLGTKYPGAFDGYKLHVIESHQKTKADTSGTAKAVIDSIKVLTNESTFTYDDIEMIRNEEASMAFGVPSEAVRTGHAYHTYTLSSPDGTVQFQLQHNVVGRTIYADGTADAVKFLAKKVRQYHHSNNADIPKVYTMMDVLKEGALE